MGGPRGESNFKGISSQLIFLPSTETTHLPAKSSIGSPKAALENSLSLELKRFKASGILMTKKRRTTKLVITFLPLKISKYSCNVLI